jgi:hypothetical protein
MRRWFESTRKHHAAVLQSRQRDGVESADSAGSNLARGTIPTYPNLAEERGPDPRHVVVRVHSSGPSRGDVRGLGSSLRCQRRKRRVRIPYVPPRWAHGEKESPLPCKQQFSVRVRVGPPSSCYQLPLRGCRRSRGASLMSSLKPVRVRSPLPIHAEFVQGKGRGPTNRRRGFDSFTPHQFSGDRWRTASRGVVAPVKRVRLPPITPGT